MFEKYKEIKEKREHFGMTKKEYFKFLVLILVALLCVVVLMYAWPRATRQEGTEVDIPRGGAEIQIPRDVSKAGEKGAQGRFEELRERLVRQRDEGAESGELTLPEIPKPPTPWEPDPEIWKQVDDSKTDQFEEQVALYALHQLNSMTQEQISKKVEEDGNIPPSDFMEHPEEFRGKFVTITGTLMLMEDLILSPNRSGLNQIWCGHIYNQRQKPYRKLYFYIYDKDREWLTQQETKNRGLSQNGDLVTLNGIFVKLYRNRTEGGAIMTYPFIIGRKLEPARSLSVKEQYPWQMLTVVGVILGGVFIFFFMAMHRDRKEDENFLRSRKFKKAGLVKNDLVRKIAAQAKGKGAAGKGEAQGTPEPAPAGEQTDTPSSAGGAGEPGGAAQKQEEPPPPEKPESST